MPATLTQRISQHRQNLSESAVQDFPVEGKVTRMIGLTLEVVGITAAIGERCVIKNELGDYVTAEVVGFANDSTYLMPIDRVVGLTIGSKVRLAGKHAEFPVGNELLGRVLDAKGEALDGLGIQVQEKAPLDSPSINPLDRDPIHEPLDVGIKAINSLLTIGKGQRIGLFAGSGVGKSVLLGMMTKYTSADVIVVGLIGERGREVKEFIEESLGEEGLRRSVVIAAPADRTPLQRLQAALYATKVAEHFRDQGLNVLLLMDSLTRFAQAQREIALAIGEPPATKGYPASVFAKLPQLVERAGNGNAALGIGSITAFYTVLAEGDDQQDPIVDSARAILDGHIILSREIAESGRYPAIDVEHSISRVMTAVTDKKHQQQVQKFRRILSKYQKNADLITVGAYVPGSDPELDRAIERMPFFDAFLKQDMDERCDFAMSLGQLQQVLTYE